MDSVEGTNQKPGVFVDTKEMLDSFSKDIIYVQLKGHEASTIFVELIRFTPGQPDNVAMKGSASRSSAAPFARQSASAGDSSSSHSAPIRPAPMAVYTSTFEVDRSGSATDSHVPPPPPWSRWGTMSTPSMPPSTQRRQPVETPRGTPRGTPQPPKKRKHVEDIRISEDATTSSFTRSPKRRLLPQPAPSSGSSSRPVQTLSPSLAMIVCPPEGEISPRMTSATSFGGPSPTAEPTLDSPSSQSVRRVKLVMPKER